MQSVFPSFPHALSSQNRTAGCWPRPGCSDRIDASAKKRSDRPVFSCSPGGKFTDSTQAREAERAVLRRYSLTSPRKTQRGWSQGHLRGQRRFS